MTNQGKRENQLEDELPWLSDLAKVEKKLKKLKPLAQSVMASHIWWNLADHRTREEMATIKSMINYAFPFHEPEILEKIMTNFGCSQTYAAMAVRSQKSQLAYKDIARAREAKRKLQGATR